MKYQEIRREEIPSLSFMRDTDYILYLGPRLSCFQKGRLESFGEEVKIIYLPDIICQLSMEVFEYNLPGIQWPEKLSAELIYDRMEKSRARDPLQRLSADPSRHKKESHKSRYKTDPCQSYSDRGFFS